MRDAEEQAAPAGRSEVAPRTGIPAGPLLLSLANGAGLAGTTAYYAAGIAGAVALGSAVTAAGAGAAAVAMRNGRRYGHYGLRRMWGRGYGGGYGRYGSGRGYGGAGYSGGGRGGYSRGFSGGTTGYGRRAPAPMGSVGTAAGAGARTLPGARRPGAAGGAVGTPPRTGRQTPGSTAAPFSPGGGSSSGGSSSRGAGAPHRRGWSGLLRRGAGKDAPGSGPAGAGAPGGAAGAFAGRGGRGADPARSSSFARRTVDAARGRLARARDGFPGALRQFAETAGQRWKKGEKGRRLWRRRLRMTRRITGTAVLSVLGAVLAQALFPFRFHAVRTWQRIWNWRAHRAQRKEAAIDAREAERDKAADRPPVADKVNTPERTGGAKTSGGAGGGTSTGGTGMQVFARAAEQVAAAYGRYSPPSMLSVAAEYEGVPEGIRHAAQAIAQLARTTAEVYPAHASVAERVSAVYMRMMQAAETADEIAPHFRRVHEADLLRHEAPRNGWSGEVMWNIGGRPGDQGEQASVFARSAEQVATVYARWTPTVMTEVAAEYESLPAGIEHLADAVNSLAVQSSDSYPVDPSVAELVAAVRHRLLSAVSAAQDVMPHFRRVHEADLRRHEAPRNGPAAEAMWNV
ncbi:hypothetical protein ACFXCZ_35465 [Streptomyces sp. NPDC059396]|uniref:hypothetical protein n=1 Tax=Streptomyces sp. NPDC059396 TaxID=3346819 RepID=UPI003691155F